MPPDPVTTDSVDDAAYATDVQEDQSLPDTDLPPVHTGPVPPDLGDAGVTRVSGQ